MDASLILAINAAQAKEEMKYAEKREGLLLKLQANGYSIVSTQLAMTNSFYIKAEKNGVVYSIRLGDHDASCKRILENIHFSYDQPLAEMLFKRRAGWKLAGEEVAEFAENQVKDVYEGLTEKRVPVEVISERVSAKGTKMVKLRMQLYKPMFELYM